MRGTHIKNGKTSSLHKCVQDEARDRGLSSSSSPRARMLARVESSPTGREATHTPGGGGDGNVARTPAQRKRQNISAGKMRALALPGRKKQEATERGVPIHCRTWKPNFVISGSSHPGFCVLIGFFLDCASEKETTKTV